MKKPISSPLSGLVPGQAVRGSTSGRPIMVLLDLLGRRTCLRILWELREDSLKFRELQSAAETSPSVLNTRLKELRAAKLLVTTPDGYQLTQTGRSLLIHILPLYEWAETWVEEF